MVKEQSLKDNHNCTDYVDWQRAAQTAGRLFAGAVFRLSKRAIRVIRGDSIEGG